MATVGNPPHTIAGKDTEKILLDVVRNLRENPEKYQRVQTALRQARTDEERVRQLLNFATSERELAALVPAGTTGDPQALAWTTVTVTTVLVPASAY